jgi:hypothetical protein
MSMSRATQRSSSFSWSSSLMAGSGRRTATVTSSAATWSETSSMSKRGPLSKTYYSTKTGPLLKTSSSTRPVLIWLAPSMAATAENAQQETSECKISSEGFYFTDRFTVINCSTRCYHIPQVPWFLTGTTAPCSRQSTPFGQNNLQTIHYQPGGSIQTTVQDCWQ